MTEHGAYSNQVLRAVLEKYQYMEKYERAFLTRLVEGTIQHMIELDYVIDQFSKVKVKKMKPVIRNILRMGVYHQSLRSGLSDGWGGSMMGTEFSDVLFGTPKPIETEANLGVMKEDEVNIIVHGHDPSLSEMICEYADDPEMIAYRFYDFLGRKIKVSIQRIICASCGKTNALLIEDMIPFSTFTFSQIIDCLDDPDFPVDNFHRSFLINKYYNVEQNYRSYCQINRRNHMLIFLPT